MKEIQLTKGYVAIVDEEDYDFVSKFKWSALVARTGKVYAFRNSSRDTGLRYRKQKQQNFTNYLHRMILPAASLVDHIDGNTLDNRRTNLRCVTKSQNTVNGGFKKGKKYKGVSKNKGCSTWRADICVKGKNIYLGSFKTLKEACAAYNIAATAHHGGYAKLNNLEEIDL